MDRIIKFRAKRLEDGRWVYGSLLQDDYGTYQFVDFIDHHETWHDIDPDTIGQFTGLYDCDGTEIYEGDIIAIRVCPCEVVYNKEIASFCIRFYFEVSPGIRPLGEWLKEETCRVVGNIHDNPDLLKGE